MLSVVVDPVMFPSLCPCASLSPATAFANMGIIFRISENVIGGAKTMALQGRPEWETQLQAPGLRYLQS